VRPLLLLDVDGPLHPWAADQPPPGYEEFRFRLSWRRAQRVWLNPDHGRLLLGLVERTGIELAWASSWSHRANATIGQAIGLPTLPVVEFAGPHADHLAGWKYSAAARFAYGRPLAWLDDDFALRPEARDRFLQREPATLLVPVDPRLGVTETEVAEIEAWCTSR
jgi:hypothetical protein